MDEYGIDEFKVFEEWIYSEKLNYPEDFDCPSLLLVKVFCLAQVVGVLNLQNATIDAIRDLATKQHRSLTSPIKFHEQRAVPPAPFVWRSQPGWGVFNDQRTTIVALEEPVTKYVPPVTASAIHYAYQETSQSSPLRRLLADIFAYDVKPEVLYDEYQSFPTEFLADVLLTTKKRLSLRLENEEADFDMNADKYHVPDSSSTPAAEVDVSKPESATEAPAIDEDETWGFGSPIKSSKKKAKKVKKTFEE